MATKASKAAHDAAGVFTVKDMFIYDEPNGYICKVDKFIKITEKLFYVHYTDYWYEEGNSFKKSDDCNPTYDEVRIPKGWTEDDVISEDYESLVTKVKSKVSFDKAKTEAKLVKVKEKLLKYLGEYFDIKNDTGALKELVGDKYSSYLFKGLYEPWGCKEHEAVYNIIEAGGVRIPCADRKNAAETFVPLHCITGVSKYERGGEPFVSFSFGGKTQELKNTKELSCKIDAIKFLWSHGYGK